MVETETGADAPVSSPSSSPVILVVDDEPPVLRLMRRVLERAKLEVLAVADAETALEQLGDDTVVDVAVIDLTLPGMDGGELARRLRGARPGLPVILTSGYDESRARAKAGDTGDDTVFLQKPFTPKQLTDAVERLR